MSTPVLLDLIEERLITEFSQNTLKDCGLYTFLNPYTYGVHRSNPQLLTPFSGIGIDGIGLVAALQCAGIAKVKRLSFDMTSLAKPVFQTANSQNWTVALVGSTNRKVKSATRSLAERFSGLNVVYIRSGYFDTEAQFNETVRHIVDHEPHLLIAGMGAPLQEKFLRAVWECGWRGIGFTCGAFIEQTADALSYYPGLVDALHLRFLYRALNEPGKWSRLITDYPLFVFRFIHDLHAR